MTEDADEKLYAAVIKAVKAAIEEVGIEEFRKTSFFNAGRTDAAAIPNPSTGYEYKTVEGSRKGPEPYRVEELITEGWENDEPGWARFDYHEEYYLRRKLPSSQAI